MQENKCTNEINEENIIETNKEVDDSIEKGEISLEDIKNLKKEFDDHFNQIRSMLKYNKEKDANVAKLNKIIQSYRDGFDTNLYKSVALNIISFREDCAKSFREFLYKELTIEQSKKYLQYIIYDLEDLLDNLGIENKNEQWLYHGKNIKEYEGSKVNFIEPIELNYESREYQEIATAKDLVEYIKSCELEMLEILKNNAILDKLISQFITQSQAYEEGLEKIILYPVIKKIIKLYQITKENINKVIDNLTEENCKMIYLQELTEVKERTEDIFVLCNVTIDNYVSDVFDPKKHRLLKIIPTDDESKNSYIENRYTDCYMVDDKVIYQQKVGVYKKQ